MRLLLVEDDIGLSDSLILLFKNNKYEADAVYDGKIAEVMIMTGIYDIIILDRNIPGQDGLTVLKNIRKKGINTPVMFLTAKNTTADKVEGLDAGADDYLTKPFSTDELLARIRALSRRNNALITGTEEITVGKSKFLPRRGELLFGKNYSSSVTLTLKETGILEMLSKNLDVPVSKEEILHKFWGYKNDGNLNNANIVEVFVSYLRKKIKPEACGFTIMTQRNLGYKIKII